MGMDFILSPMEVPLAFDYVLFILFRSPFGRWTASEMRHKALIFLGFKFSTFIRCVGMVADEMGDNDGQFPQKTLKKLLLSLTKATLERRAVNQKTMKIFKRDNKK